MFADQDEVDNEEELEDDELDTDEDDEDLALAATEEEDEDESSLEELLAQRAAARRGTDESDEDEDLMALSSEPDVIPSIEPIPARVIPLKDRQEFVCSRCRLVKARVQLADADRGLCRDCV